MNIKIDVEMTPEEMRRLVGLPDLEAFNRELMEQIRQRMMAGVEGYDPMSLFQPYLSGAAASMDFFRRIMGMAASGGDKTEQLGKD